MTIDYEIFNRVCEHLPEDWEITFSCERGCLAVNLYDPDGCLVDIADDDMSVDQMVNLRIDHARESDGLLPVFDHE